MTLISPLVLDLRVFIGIIFFNRRFLLGWPFVVNCRLSYEFEVRFLLRCSCDLIVLWFRLYFLDIHWCLHYSEICLCIVLGIFGLWIYWSFRIREEYNCLLLVWMDIRNMWSIVLDLSICGWICVLPIALIFLFVYLLVF